MSDVTSIAQQRTVGRYELLRELGRGATSVVYLARQVDLDRHVAVKELVGFQTAGTGATERFLRESRLAGSLNHPNVVTVYEYFEADGTPFIAMEYLERGSLRPFVGSVSLPQAMGVLEGALGGLAHAHERSVVHRDLKPENLLVTSTGAVKVADFGIAKALESESVLTSSGATVGTPAYMAPEQALGGEVGPAADLYATGVIAYELLAGNVPFRGSNVAMAVMLQHLNEPVPSLRAARPELDPHLCTWVERMLEKEPRSRPPSAAEAWDELDEIALRALGPRWRRTSRLGAANGHSAAPESATPATRASPAAATHAEATHGRRIGPASVLLALALLLAAAGVGAAIVLTRGDEEASATTDRSTTAPQTTEGEPKVAGPVLERLTLATGADSATATVGLTGRALGPGSVVVRDRDLADGHAWLELRQAGITSQVKSQVGEALTARVRTGKNVVRVDIRTEPGAYETLRIRRPNGRTVVVVLEEPAAPSTSPPPSSGSGGSSDTTPTAPTSPPTKPKPPEVKTG